MRFAGRTAWLMMVLFVVNLAAVGAAAQATSADVTGTWKGSFEFHDSSMPLVFHLAVANGVVTGTVEGLPTTPAEIHDGKSGADGITFSVSTDYQGQTYKLIYKGKVSAAGDAIAFTFGTDDGNWSTQMTAAKSVDAPAVPAPAVVDVTGTWKASFDYNGQSVPLVLHLTNENGVVRGTVEGLPTTPAEIEEGKLDGDTVTFWLNTQYEGATYKLVYKGKATGETIVFTLGTDDASWSTQMTATKQVAGSSKLGVGTRD
jgi:hypothetical protein